MTYADYEEAEFLRMGGKTWKEIYDSGVVKSMYCDWNSLCSAFSQKRRQRERTITRQEGK